MAVEEEAREEEGKKMTEGKVGENEEELGGRG